jgi:hypothetical protein
LTVAQLANSTAIPLKITREASDGVIVGLAMHALACVYLILSCGMFHESRHVGTAWREGAVRAALNARRKIGWIATV